MINRVIIWSVLFSLCCSCREEAKELRGAELCEQISNVSPYHITGGKQIDSLAGLAVGLSPAECYAVLFNALIYSDKRSVAFPAYDERKRYYLRQLGTLAFPEVRDKADGFLLLGCYDREGANLMEIAPRLFDPVWITSLLSDMENRWSLTPQENLRFQMMKSGIYFHVFREYKSALIIIKDGLRFARENGADQKMIMDLFRTLFQSSLRLEETDRLMALEEDFMAFAEDCQFDSLARNAIYQTYGTLYEQQGDYNKAYDCLSKIKNLRSVRYFPMFTRVYAGIDSIPAALDYIEYWRKKQPHAVILAIMAWDEACVRQKMGDSVGYERCLCESVELFDRFNHLSFEVNNCEPSEAYARMLWQRGRYPEAIQRMKLVSDKLVSGRDYVNADFLDLHACSAWMSRFRLLRDYYNYAGRPVDAFRQALLCDSLEQQLTKARLQRERRKITTAVYTTELVRNLELRAMEFRQEQQKVYFTCFMLGMTFLGVVVLFVLYRRREQQLNILYARQKELEQLQAEKLRMVPQENEKISPEEQLFRELERQFYKEEFFRNPGFSRDDLCRLGGSNRMYVSTCINKYAGTNINQWINKARIDYAIRLIGEGEDDLTKLSELSGFSSIKSFFRSFKQFTNLTPRQYIVRDRQKSE